MKNKIILLVALLATSVSSFAASSETPDSILGVRAVRLLKSLGCFTSREVSEGTIGRLCRSKHFPYRTNKNCVKKVRAYLELLGKGPISNEEILRRTDEATDIKHEAPLTSGSILEKGAVREIGEALWINSDVKAYSLLNTLCNGSMTCYKKVEAYLSTSKTTTSVATERAKAVKKAIEHIRDTKPFDAHKFFRGGLPYTHFEDGEYVEEVEK